MCRLVYCAEIFVCCSFWSYELSKRMFASPRRQAESPEWLSVLLCGGIAGVVTWASVFPLGSFSSVYAMASLVLTLSVHMKM